MEKIKWARKLLKLFGAVFPLIYFFSNQDIMIGLLGGLSLLFLIIDFLRFKKDWNKALFKKLHFVLKDKEKNRISGTAMFLIGSLLAVFLFRKEVAIVAILFLIFGDGFAEIIGRTYGKHKAFNKSLEGSVACFVACLIVGGILLLVFPYLTLFKVLIGAVGACVIEFLPLKVDDNLSIPLVVGILVSVL